MKSKIFGVVIVLIALVSGYLYLNNREEPKEGSVHILYQDQSIACEPNTLKSVSIQGETVNGKGEVSEVNAKGIELSALLDQSFKSVKALDKSMEIEYEQVTVEADDAYSATLTKEEIEEDGKVYLAFEKDNQYTLIVFGDSNSKRNVRNVVKVIVE